MILLVKENWILFLIALIIGIAVAYWVFVITRRTRVSTNKMDALDDGAAPAVRNQALIDTPPAALSPKSAPKPAPTSIPIPPATPQGLAGVGVAVAAIVEEQQIEGQEISDQAAQLASEGPTSGGLASGGLASERLASTEGDDLSRIKGVGPKLKNLLISLGITRFSQIAAWSDADIDRIDAQLGRFEGRIRRDDWTSQAALLAQGDTQGYEDKFGKL